MWARARTLLAALFRRHQVESDIQHEAAFHIEQQADDLVRSGMPRGEALRRARAEFGSVRAVSEACRQSWGTRVIDEGQQDLRHAVRSLGRHPGFTAVVLAIMAVAIGASTAIFSIVDAVFLRPLPYADPDRLVAVLGVNTRADTTFGGGATTTQTFLSWREQQTAFEDIALVGSFGLQSRNERNEPAMLAAQRVTAGFFRLLRIQPVFGREFRPEDEADGTRAVILSHQYWSRRFGGDPSVIGRTLQLNDQPWTVVGVLPRTVAYPPATVRPVEIYVPQAFRPADRVRGKSHNYNGIVIARLKDDVRIEAAADQVNAIADALDRQFPAWEPGWRVRILPLHEHLVGRVRDWMRLLLVVTVCVLLIATANVAHLLVARAISRRREIAVLLALGAGRARIVRAMAVETVVITLLASFVGLAVAVGAVEVLREWLPENIPRVAAIAVDARVFTIVVLVTLSIGVVLGLAPSSQTRSPVLTGALKDGDSRLTASARSRRLRSVLVIAEVALSVVLVTAGGLFLVSFMKVASIAPGFDYEDTLIVRVALRRDPARESLEDWKVRGAAYVANVLDVLRVTPGVVDVAATDGGVPLSRGFRRDPITSDAIPADQEVDIRRVTANYFSLLKIPVVTGRTFNDYDHAGTPAVVVVNDTAAKRFWPGGDAVGSRVRLWDRERTVIGVVADIRQYGPEAPSYPGTYLPWSQESEYDAELLIRTGVAPSALEPSIKRAIWSLNPDQTFPVRLETLEDSLNTLLANRRFNMAVLVIIAALGLLIAVVGIFGLLMFEVNQRTNEIGIRIALGASQAQIVWLVLSQAAVVVFCGIMLGAVTAWPLSALAQDFLFELKATDWRVLVGVAVVLALSGLVAAVHPARRAARLDPARVLRES